MIHHMEKSTIPLMCFSEMPGRPRAVRLRRTTSESAKVYASIRSIIAMSPLHESRSRLMPSMRKSCMQSRSV